MIGLALFLLVYLFVGFSLTSFFVKLDPNKPKIITTSSAFMAGIIFWPPALGLLVIVSITYVLETIWTYITSRNWGIQRYVDYLNGKSKSKHEDIIA